jgi:hypothetical protein
VNDYFLLEETCETALQKGTILEGDITKSRVEVRYHDLDKNKIWINLISGTPDAHRRERFRVESNPEITVRINRHVQTEGSGFDASIATVDENGKLMKIVIHNEGNGYVVQPYVEIISETGTGAVLTPYGKHLGGVEKVTVIDEGTEDATATAADILPHRTIDYDKQIMFFKHDHINDMIPTSNATMELRLTTIGTFANATPLALLNSNCSVKLATTTSTEITRATSMDDVGKLSDNSQHLHDGEYYQLFSYVLKTLQPINKWRGVVRRLTHPAGTALFAECQQETLINTHQTVASIANASNTAFLYYDKQIGAFAADRIDGRIQKSNGDTFYDIVVAGRFPSATPIDLYYSKAPKRIWS